MCLKSNKKQSLEWRTRQCLKQLTARSDFATTKYTLHKIIKAKDVASFPKIGDRQVLYSSTVYVKAGINFDNFNFKNVQIDEGLKEITLTLPKAQIFSTNMPSLQREKVYERKGLFRKKFDSGEIAEFFKQGEQSVKEEIKNMGIIEEAQRNAMSLFKIALLQLGYNVVNISFES